MSDVLRDFEIKVSDACDVHGCCKLASEMFPGLNFLFDELVEARGVLSNSPGWDVLFAAVCYGCV